MIIIIICASKSETGSIAECKKNWLWSIFHVLRLEFIFGYDSVSNGHITH